jgi:hypothetical protein
MLIELTRWLEHSALGQGIHNSSWLFPFIEVFHLIAIGILGGAVLLIDLRLFGWGLRRHAPGEIARDVQPVLNIGLIVLIVSGVLLYASEGAKMYFNTAFRFKMICLFLAVLYSFTWHRKIAAQSPVNETPLGAKLAASLSLLLWICVGLGGRAIGFI